MPEQTPFDFADGKDPQAFRTIGEVAHAFGLKQHVLRYWEEQFAQLRPLKRSGGRRYYRPEDVALVAEINHLLYSEGFTIRGAKQALGGKGGKAAGPPAGDQDEARIERSESGGAIDGEVMARLRVVRETLSRALQGG